MNKIYFNPSTGEVSEIELPGWYEINTSSLIDYYVTGKLYAILDRYPKYIFSL